jgi:hypothetical protein
MATELEFRHCIIAFLNQVNVPLKQAGFPSLEMLHINLSEPTPLLAARQSV